MTSTKQPHHAHASSGGAKLASGLSGLRLSDDKPDEAMIVLRFLLPGFCHLSADESALKVLIENQAHTLLGKYFFSEWKKWTNNKEDSDAMTTLTTLLGIFLNFTVMRPDLVKKDEVFRDLCKHIMSSVSDVISRPEHVFLLANLVILGLMLVRLQRVEQNTGQNLGGGSDLVPFFRVVLELLRSGIQLKGKNKNELPQRRHQLASACKTNWDDISELWFLGLQVLTSLLSEFSVLRVMVQESSWCKEIEVYFRANQLLDEIREALSSFLKEFQRLQV